MIDEIGFLQERVHCLERDLVRRIEEVQAATRTLRMANDKISTLERELAAERETHQHAEAELAARAEDAYQKCDTAQARVAVLEEADRTWEKHSLVQIVRERDELRERVTDLERQVVGREAGQAILERALEARVKEVAALTAVLERTLLWFETMANTGTLAATVDLRGRLQSVLNPVKETTSLQQGVDAVSPPDRQVFKSDDAAKETT